MGKTKYLGLFAVLFFMQGAAFAASCFNDNDCESEKRCVAPEDNRSSGICMIQRDQAGHPLYHDNSPTPHLVPACSSDSDCGPDGYCFIKQNSTGVCSQLSSGRN